MKTTHLCTGILAMVMAAATSLAQTNTRTNETVKPDRTRTTDTTNQAPQTDGMEAITSPTHAVSKMSTTSNMAPSTTAFSEPMKIYVIGMDSTNDQIANDMAADALQAALTVPDHIKVETVLPDKAQNIRTALKTNKEKLITGEFTHIMYVNVTYTATMSQAVPGTKLFKANLTIKLYDLTTNSFTHTWKKSGLIAGDTGTNDNDPNAREAALMAAVNEANDIFQPTTAEKTTNGT